MGNASRIASFETTGMNRCKSRPAEPAVAVASDAKRTLPRNAAPTGGEDTDALLLVVEETTRRGDDEDRRNEDEDHPSLRTKLDLCDCVGACCC